MRNLIFKNLTSSDRTRRVISSCEILLKEGVRTTIRRHFIYKVIEIKEDLEVKPQPQIYVYRICNHLRQQESYYCRMKASLYAKCNGRLFQILFGHSFKIDLRSTIEISS